MNKMTSTTGSTQKPEFQSVELGDGRTATLLVADLNEGQKLCVISESLLFRLRGLLPRVSFPDLKVEFIGSVRETKTLEEFVAVLTSELDFHNSVRKIDKFIIRGQDEEKMVQAVANHSPEPQIH